MIADILTEEQRQEGFGILRVVGNMAWIIGPTVGGFIAGYSFFALFVIDAVVSSIVALLFFLFIKESKPELEEGQEEESLGRTFVGYFRVLRDKPFVGFMLALILASSVYQQMYHSLSVFLRDQHGVSPQGYGFVLTSSAITVIFFQFWTTRRIKVKPPFLMMALGTVFYMIGFGMYGFVGVYWLFVTAMIVITIGEMIIMPTSATLAANFAPKQMRGRYLAVFSLSWVLPSTFAPAAAGYILDNFDPNLLWIGGGILCAVAAFAFYLLHLRLGDRKRFASVPQEAEVVAQASGG